MLERSDVAARLPAQDLERAKAFYADKLGLKTDRGKARRSSLSVWKRLVLFIRVGWLSIG